jgi:predicted nucleotidyltransferase
MAVVVHPPLERVVERARQDPGILAGILFGSRARGDASPASDYDVALVLQPGAASRLAASRKRLEYLALADLDLVVFQQLPLHIRSRVLKEGAVLFSRDDDALYDLAVRTARAFCDFRHVQRAYLDEVARG